MNGLADTDLRNIENREWHLWFLAVTLIMILASIITATFFLILGDTYQNLSSTRAIAFRALGGLFILITLFCLYVLHARFTFARMRALLIDMTSMVASTEDLNVLLSSFTRRIADISSATLCQIALLTQSGPALKIKSAHMARKADWKPQIGKVYPLGKVPVCRQVIDTRQPIVLHRDTIERLTNDTDTMELLTGGLKDLHTIHIIPMMTKGRILGIIILGKARGFRRSFFTSTKTLLIQALAKQAATALDHVRLIEETKKTSFSLLEAALDSTADGILVINRTGKVTNFNAQFAGMWTIPRNVLETCEHDAVLGYVMNQLRHPEQFLDKIKEITSQPEIQTYDAIECKDGRIYECFSQPQRVDAEIVGRVWSFRDITERRKAQEALENQAIRDPLTELYNRRYFNTRMKEEIARADRSQYTVAILLCDIDHFKAINDSRGHQFGDETLKTAAQRLKESTRGADLVFRWGGDEMVVVLANSNRQGLLIVGERIRKAIQTLSEQLHINLDVSIGVALFPEHGRTVDELIRLADRALYIAKKGGDKIHIGEEEYQLDEQTIKVVFQPVVDVRSNEVMGYEALSRDAKGKMGILELFQRYQAIGQLSELKQLCLRSQLEVSKGAAFKRVFINVDFTVLSHLDVLPKPSNMDVILEISEAEVLHNVENHLKLAMKWRGEGYKFAIDDFGAGFISLPFIARLIPEYIKIDRSTLLQAKDSEKFRLFLKDLVSALRNYTTEGIIAEGIETEKELQVVKEIGLHLVQGYLLGRPEELKSR